MEEDQIGSATGNLYSINASRKFFTHSLLVMPMLLVMVILHRQVTLILLIVLLLLMLHTRSYNVKKLLKDMSILDQIKREIFSNYKFHFEIIPIIHLPLSVTYQLNHELLKERA